MAVVGSVNHGGRVSAGGGGEQLVMLQMLSGIFFVYINWTLARVLYWFLYQRGFMCFWCGTSLRFSKEGGVGCCCLILNVVACMLLDVKNLFPFLVSFFCISFLIKFSLCFWSPLVCLVWMWDWSVCIFEWSLFQLWGRPLESGTQGWGEPFKISSHTYLLPAPRLSFIFIFGKAPMLCNSLCHTPH